MYDLVTEEVGELPVGVLFTLVLLLSDKVYHHGHGFVNSVEEGENYPLVLNLLRLYKSW